MNPRERTLALLLGGFAALFVGKWLVVDVVWGPLSQRKTKLERAEDDLDAKKVQLANQQEAAAALKNWKAASLAADQEKNPTVVYRGYLMDLLNAAGIKSPTVNVNPPRLLKDAYTVIPFTIDAHCDLAQLSKLLYEFKRTDLMHQIKSIDVRPHVNSASDKIEYLIAKLDGEALAFADANSREIAPGDKPDGRKIADFKYFAEKNFFQPTKIVPKELAKAASARDDRGAVVFYGVSTSHGVDTFEFYNGATSEPLRFPVGFTFEVRGMTGKIVGFNEHAKEVLIQVGEKLGAVRMGQKLSTWKETSNRPAAIKTVSQPTL